MAESVRRFFDWLFWLAQEPSTQARVSWERLEPEERVPALLEMLKALSAQDRQRVRVSLAALGDDAKDAVACEEKRGGD